MGSFKISDKKQHFCGGGKEKEKNKRFFTEKGTKSRRAVFDVWFCACDSAVRMAGETCLRGRGLRGFHGKNGISSGFLKSKNFIEEIVKSHAKQKYKQISESEKKAIDNKRKRIYNSTAS